MLKALLTLLQVPAAQAEPAALAAWQVQLLQELQGKAAQVEQAAQQQTAALLMSADSPDITTEPYLIIVIPQAMSPLLPEIPGVPEQEERVLMDATAHPVPAAQAAPAVTAARSPALAQALPI